MKLTLPFLVLLFYSTLRTSTKSLLQNNGKNSRFFTQYEANHQLVQEKRPLPSQLITHTAKYSICPICFHSIPPVHLDILCLKYPLESLPYLKITTCSERSYSQSSNNSVNSIPKKHFFFNSNSLSCPLPPKSHSKICKGASSITVIISGHSSRKLQHDITKNHGNTCKNLAAESTSCTGLGRLD